MHKSAKYLAAAALVVLAQPALAHTGHNTGFALRDGLLHPLLGPDHLLAMVAVGMWAAQLGGRALLALPLSFVGAMTAGAMLAVHGYTGWGIEIAILASVVVLGACIALDAKPEVAVAALICGLFALAHGQAHALEVPEGASIAAYIAGFVLATAMLHAAGVALGRTFTSAPIFSRASGAAIAVAGVVLATV